MTGHIEGQCAWSIVGEERELDEFGEAQRTQVRRARVSILDCFLIGS